MSTSSPTAAELLDALCDAGLIADLDRCFARLLADLDENDAIALPAALLSAAHRGGHTSLPLERCAERRLVDCLDEFSSLPMRAGIPTSAQLPGAVSEYRLPSRTALQAVLEASDVVADRLSETPAQHPLAYDRGHLYLQRLFVAEQSLAQRLCALAEPVAAVAGTPTTVGAPATAGASAELQRLFPESGSHETRRAAQTAVERRLCIVTGGPGTGKTTFVTRLIALFLELDLAKPQRIALATPTGKAAARLQESVTAHLAELASGSQSPHEDSLQATTLHRLLRQRDRMALLDLLVVDECSMVDLEMMARLVDALPPSARLVLLGDAEQLGSVRPGAVFRDLCMTAKRDSALAPAVVTLTKSHRFPAAGSIGRLAAAILDGNAAAALTVLREQRASAAELQSMPSVAAFERYAARYAEDWCAPLIEALRHGDQHAPAFPTRRVLCAHRRGPFGAERLNRLVEERLRDMGSIPAADEFYIGRPILVTRNDPETGLANGDAGVVIAANGASGARKVWFPELSTRNGERRLVSPLRLPAHESLFALTVHRAQGSEYVEVDFVPGPAESRVSNRELFYTAVTRARTKVVVLAEPDSVRASIQRRAARSSALLERLSG